MARFKAIAEIELESDDDSFSGLMEKAERLLREADWEGDTFRVVPCGDTDANPTGE